MGFKGSPHEILFHFEEYGIEVKIYEGIPVNCYKFNLVVFYNKSEGGVIVGEVVNNINFCVEEKTEKMKNSTANYDVLELALVDGIGFQYANTYSKDVISFIKNKIQIRIWNKITIINPQNYREFHEF